MANRDRNNGFRVVSNRDGSPFNGAVYPAFSDTDNLFIGDLVKQDAAAQSRGDGVYRTVDRIDAAGDVISGVVVSFEPDPAALDRLYHAASTSLLVYIADVKDVVLEAQSDDATMEQSDVGLNVSPTVTAGNTTTGLSGMEVDGDTAATTNTLTLQIIGFVDRADNDSSSSVANQRVLVTVNSSADANLLAGV